MELNQLNYFKAVAKTGSITKAAGELYITQSALSRVILRLETELGTPLFDRQGGKILLNEKGKLFLEHITVALDEIEKGVKAVTADIPRSKIVIYNYLVVDLFRQIVEVCQAYFPNLSFVNYNYEALSDEDPIKTYLPSIILGPSKEIEGYTFPVKYREKWCVIYNNQYYFRSSCSGDIDLRHLADENIVFFGTLYDRAFIEKMFDDNGLSPNITYAESMAESGSLINRCKAIGIVPVNNFRNLVEQMNNMPISAMKIGGYNCERNVYLGTAKKFPLLSDEKAAFEKIEGFVSREMEKNIEFYNGYF